ncbi:MAG: hypothetical protein HOC70_16470 [Gammaproteobacteria bacterium]|jgi:hypothetical protein|nr:hypothetical protein [Gammaproteobacteria bacterium]MBT4494841.1 hypothetical protein [Gammaproteobacteria bacterium]
MSVEVGGIIVSEHFDSRFEQTIEKSAGHFIDGDDVRASFAMSYVMNRMFPGTMGDMRSYKIGHQAYQDLG